VYSELVLATKEILVLPKIEMLKTTSANALE
jgi:hypothetical protein